MFQNTVISTQSCRIDTMTLNSFGQDLLLVSVHAVYAFGEKVDQSGILGVYIQKYVSLTIMFKVNIDYKECFASRNTYFSFIHYIA